MLVSLGLIALGPFVVYETGGIAETQGYAQIGPRLFPYVIGAGLTLCGAVLAWHALSGGWRHVPLDQEGHDAPDWPAFAIISAGIVLHMAIIGWAGFIIASTLLFVLIARGFGSRRPARDARRRGPAGRRRLLHLHAGPGSQSAQGPLRRRVMDTFSALMSGFAVALTIKNLMWGFVGVTLGTAIGVLPGVGPALTIALLLPATAKVDPTGALIMFAGHLLRRDVRRLDDVDPAQHAGRIGDHRHRARRQHDGQARPRRDRRWRRPRSARSSPEPSPRSCSP